ncbi:MAG: Lrp/AsnC family transcriptional regulator [Acidimicrobiia bacterium]
MTDFHLDQVDKLIVKVLSDDGRATYSEIAKVVGVSVGTVRNRVREMRNTGALHFNIWLDPFRVGLGVSATFMIRTRPGSIESVADALQALDETGYIASLAGDYDITVDAFCRDVNHLNRLLRDGIQSIDGVERVATYLVTEVKYSSSMNIAGLFSDDPEDGAE